MFLSTVQKYAKSPCLAQSSADFCRADVFVYLDVQIINPQTRTRSNANSAAHYFTLNFGNNAEIWYGYKAIQIDWIMGSH